MIVVDASAALEVLFRTPAGAVLERRLLGSGEPMVAPHLIDVEVAQVVRRFVLMGTPLSFCEAVLEDWKAWTLLRYSHELLLDRMWSLRTNFTAYDAAYLALAERLDVPLVTRDAKMAVTGVHAATVEVY